MSIINTSFIKDILKGSRESLTDKLPRLPGQAVSGGKYMKKKYRVKSKKQTDHIYTVVADCAEYIDALSAHADRTVFAWKEKGVLHDISYTDFVSLVRDFSLGLSETFGQNNCRTVAIIGETSPYWIAAYLAVIAAGCIALPMDKELDPAEIAKFLELADASAVVYSQTFDKVFPEMARDHKTLRYLIPMNGEADGSEAGGTAEMLPYDKVLLRGRGSSIPFEPDRDTERIAEILFTSGTTGSSKCVKLCQRNIFSVITSACESVDFRADDVLVSVLPLHHTYELACSLAAMDYGCKICINDSLRYVLKNFKEYQPTALVLVPMFVTTMYKKIQSEARRSGKGKILSVGTKIAHYLSFAGIDMSDKLFRDIREAFGGRLEKIICGGAALNPEMIEIFEAFGISIYEGYGITECAPLVAVTPYFKRKCGSVGPSVPCCKVRIDGTQVTDEGYELGEIQVQGENVMLGYAYNDAANSEAFTDDGWFRTGDIGYMDADGFIYITGRQKSVIVLDNGKNVFPEEIEEYLADIDTIAEAVVIGRNVDDDGLTSETKLVAVIYPAYDKYQSLGENELRAEIQKSITALNKRLPSFKQIHKLEFRKTEFEKTTTKKIKRHLVK